jgi:SAM-dependent methyltransferase
MRKYWTSRDRGDSHGFDKYTVEHPRIPILIRELNAIAHTDDLILDLGCNCGFYLSRLKIAGFSHLFGIDISKSAIDYGRKEFNLNGVDLIIGSFEEVLPELVSDGKRFDLVYTLGATIELVHPSFDIVGHMCKLSEKYVILIISEWGHAYPRFWEYEFNRNGFLLVKCIRPYDGGMPREDFFDQDSLMVFERINNNSVQ